MHCPALRTAVAGGLALCAAAGPARAQAPAPDPFEHCAALTEPEARLRCFDDALEQARTAPPSPSRVLDAVAPPARRSLLVESWAIGSEPRDSRFDIRAHHANYLLPVRYSTAPNLNPSTPAQPAPAQALSIEPLEAKFQVSFKVKVADFARDYGALWIGYTQLSNWQVYNGAESRPFRETNYEPEFMWAYHPDQSQWGWRLRLLAVGLNHQSNGRSDPLSRSWNRILGQIGIERGPVAIVVRPWYRLPEQTETDDNPDINDYLGRGDLTVFYDAGSNKLSLTVRGNFTTGKGAAQFGWTFPLARSLRGYVQVFTGYGETLIDYNWRQNTFGIGIAISDPT